MAELRAQQQRFVAEYLVDGNATKAATRAGYSKRTAGSQGARLLKNVEISGAIKKEQKKLLDKTHLTKEMVIEGLLGIAKADVRKLFNKDGSLKDISELPTKLAMSIAGVEINDLYDGVGADRVKIGETKTVKLPDKVRAWELLGKTMKMFTDKLEIKSADGLAERMKAARERVNAIKRGK